MQIEQHDTTAMNSYKTHLQVLTQHCDATGIVFFPRYSEMAHEVLERWFDEALDWSFARMQGGENLALAIVHCESAYPTASRLGDHLIWRLNVTSVGRTSLDVSLVASCGGERRVALNVTAVLSETGIMRARVWPDQMRARFADYLQSSEGI